MPSQRAIFLDRDGTINEDSADFVKTWDAFHWRPGTAHALLRLHQAGYLLIVITNQSGLKRGIVQADDLAYIHRQMTEQLATQKVPIAAIYHCPHYIDDDCRCRKPRPGMILQAGKEHDIDLVNSWMIGDAKRDIEAGQAAGCQTYLLRGTDTLQDAADAILTGATPATTTEAAQTRHL